MITKGKKVTVNPTNFTPLYPKKKPVEDVESYRREAKAAIRGGLCYPESVLIAINKAKTVGEIQRIMRTARQAM